jgi:hypothetical protein
MFAPMDIPGAITANYLKNNGISTGSNFKNQPAFYSGEKMSNVTDADAMALNPLNYAGLEAIPELGMNLIKGAKALPGVIKTSKESGLLSNAYKLNPLAFKPNSEMGYRMLGKNGFEDALETGLLRAKPVPNQSSSGISLARNTNRNPNTGKLQGALDRPYFADGVIDERYAADYMAAVNKAENNLIPIPTHKGIAPAQAGNIPLENAKLYKKDWLHGYKEVPKELPGSPNTYDNVQKAGFMNPLALADRVIPRLPTPGNYFGVEGSWNNLSPLNIIPGYGKKLSNTTDKLPVGFRKFGNSLDDVISSKTLKPKGGNRMGAKQIESEGNWAEQNKVNEAYNGVFEATMNPNIEGSNIKLQNMRNRNGILGTTKEGDVAIPLTDPGLSFNRRLPFSNKYVPINKQKLLDNKFQLATQLPHVQSLIEKYGIAAGHAAVLGYLYNGEKGAKENLKTINKYSVDPVINWSKKEWNSLKKVIDKKEEGGSTNEIIETELTPEEIEWYKSQGYEIEELD